MVKKEYIHMSIISGLMFVIFMGLILASIQNKYMVEGFGQPGVYPVAVVKPLLYDSYNVSKNPGLSMNGAEQNYVNKPVFPATSSNTNNIRYWRRPTNGLCTPPNLCGNLYIDTDQNIPPSAIPLEWDVGTRVNFYVSDYESCI